MKQFFARLATAVKHIFLVSYAAIALVPFLWVLISAFKNNTTIFTAPFSMPESWAVTNFVNAWSIAKIGVYFKNSLFISFTVVIMQIFVVSMATYAMSRLLHSRVLTTLFSFGLMIPIHAMLIPNFLSMKNLGLLNTPLSVILVYSSGNIAFSQFLLSSFMNSIPRELDEAAMVDGASYARIFFSILLPICKPGLATIATFAFLHSWNEFLYASVFLTKDSNMTIAEGLGFLKGEFVTDYGLLCAGLIFSIVPVVIMYVTLQEQVVKGMTAGAVKG